MNSDEIPVGKAQDLRGQKFGRWTVLYRVLNNNNRVTWHCQCDCGKEGNITANDLKRGHSKSCGCLKYDNHCNIKDLTGIKFGKLVPLYLTEQRKHGNAIWHCKCDCGKECDVQANHLLSGNTKSCGCYQKEQSRKKSITNLTGLKFEKLTVLYDTKTHTQYNRAIWHCRCECGNELDVSSDSLLSGHRKSCGCIKSNGEELIQHILKDNNIKYTTQKYFDTCRFYNTNNLLFFDFYVNNTYLIEYDGIQHFKALGGWNTEDHLQEIQKRDFYKNQWCKDNNIPLIRIPYTHLDNLCIEDLLLETTQFRVV